MPLAPRSIAIAVIPESANIGSAAGTRRQARRQAGIDTSALTGSSAEWRSHATGSVATMGFTPSTPIQ